MTASVLPVASVPAQPTDPDTRRVDLADPDARLAEVAARVAALAASHASSVDAEGRFPREAIDALRADGALAALVPASLGGAGASMTAVAKACRTLGRACSSTGMVFAMHSIQVASLVRHADGEPFRSYLSDLAREQRLIGSVTSEVTTGGDMGRSSAAVVRDDAGQATLAKQAPTVSYGGYADDLLTTARSGPDAEPGDQVLVLTRAGQHELAQVSSWDTLGMRGTCSPGFTMTASFPADQVLPAAFSTISAETMVPVSHLLWAHLWTGIAAEALDRARAFVRAGAKRTGSPGPGGRRLSVLTAQLSGLQAEINACLAHFEAESEVSGRPGLSTMASALRYNNLKITASETAAALCQGALSVTGFAGYKNDTPFSVGRQLRDTLSASLMVSNDRLHETNASLLLVVKDPR